MAWGLVKMGNETFEDKAWQMGANETMSHKLNLKESQADLTHGLDWFCFRLDCHLLVLCTLGEEG